MKTKVRIQASTSRNTFDHKNYDHYQIDVLTLEYPDQSDSRKLTVAGSITFQRNEGSKEWYGMSFYCNTSKPEHLRLLARVAAHVEKTRMVTHPQPKEVLESIGAEEYVYYSEVSNFIPVTDNGKNVYEVVNKGSVWTRMVAEDEKEMRRFIARDGSMKRFESPVVKYVGQVRLRSMIGTETVAPA